MARETRLIFGFSRMKRVGLLRHFPVREGYPRGWCTAVELAAWRDRYDGSPVVPGAFDLGGVDWVRCVCSPLPRARDTAARVFSGPVEVLEDLKEAEFGPLGTGWLRLPALGWRLWMQVAWRVGHASQREFRDAFRQRVHRAADRLERGGDPTLVVSHAGMMLYLGRELARRGFRGPRLGVAEHARAYVFERG